MMLELGEVRRDGRGGAVRFERRFRITPMELWPFLTEAEHLSQWITPGVTIEARLGGRILFPWPTEPHMNGEITVYDAPHVLEYSWREGDVVSSVRMELRPSSGGTLLAIDHTGLPLRDAPGFAAGWHAHLDWLVAVLRGAGAGFDQKARFAELAETYGWEGPQAG
jgi:uncharacterized protein YndB with AHSA1/START domain